MSAKLVKRALAQLDRGAPKATGKRGVSVSHTAARRAQNELTVRSLLDAVRSEQHVSSNRNERAAMLAQAGNTAPVKRELMQRVLGASRAAADKKEDADADTKKDVSKKKKKRRT